MDQIDRRAQDRALDSPDLLTETRITDGTMGRERRDPKSLPVMNRFVCPQTLGGSSCFIKTPGSETLY